MTMRKKLYFDNSKSKWSRIVFISTIIKIFLRCIDNIGAVVTAFLQDCHEATGFAWQLIGGGLDKSGEIKVVMYAMSMIFFSTLFDVRNRCSAGKTTDGQKFQDTHRNWQPGLVSPWYDFLRLRHRKFIIFYHLHHQSYLKSSYRRTT